MTRLAVLTAIVLIAAFADVATVRAAGTRSVRPQPDPAAVAVEDADAAGEWTVSFSSPRGPLEFTMYVLQDGRRLTGRLTNESGEFPLRGSVEGAGFTIAWSFPDTGGPLEITFGGTVDGDTLSGTARLGTRGSGQLSGTRVGR